MLLFCLASLTMSQSLSRPEQSISEATVPTMRPMYKRLHAVSIGLGVSAGTRAYPWI